MSLIRYAGYDPHENDFSDLDHNDLMGAEHRIERPANFHRPEGINVARAAQLRDEGLTWRQIGELLAIEESRPIQYLASSVYQAVYKISVRK